jgi:hypothetical protein
LRAAAKNFALERLRNARLDEVDNFAVGGIWIYRHGLETGGFALVFLAVAHIFRD